jgi:hypothetical protein
MATSWRAFKRTSHELGRDLRQLYAAGREHEELRRGVAFVEGELAALGTCARAAICLNASGATPLNSGTEASS